MQIYDYTKISSCFILGHINGNFSYLESTIVHRLSKKERYKVVKHPKEIEREAKLKARREAVSITIDETVNTEIGVGGMRSAWRTIRRGSKITACDKKDQVKNPSKLFIVNGCNTFYEKDSEIYKKKLSMLNDVLEDNESYLLLIRGNDNPMYFNEDVLGLSNIKTIKDCSIVRLRYYNCLCIGGYISIDRTWKKEEEKRFGKSLYFKDEKMQYDEEAIDKIITKYNIGCIITTTSPSFVYPSSSEMCRTSWCDKDKELANDLIEERMIMDKLYGRLMTKGKKPYIWVYSRFFYYTSNRMNDIVFLSLAIDTIVNLNEKIEEEFNISLSKPLKNNDGKPSSSNTAKRRLGIDGDAFEINHEPFHIGEAEMFGR